MTIGNGAITGTLYKNEGWSSGYLKGPGYYLALKFTSSDWSQYDSVKVGLDPSAQSGIVEILNDPDKNGVFKVKQNLSQKFVVEYRKGDAVERDVYDLSGLTLSEEPPTPPTPTGSVICDIHSTDAAIFGGYSDMGIYTTRTITQNIETFEDNSTIEPGSYIGTISGEIVSSITGEVQSDPAALGFKINEDAFDAIEADMPADAPEGTALKYKLYWTEYDANNQSLGSGHQLGQAVGNPAEETNRIGFAKTGVPYIDIYDGAAELDLTVRFEFINVSGGVPTVIGDAKEFSITYMVGGLITPTV